MGTHKSDCAIHNAPALPVGPCDCGVSDAPEEWITCDLCEGSGVIAYRVTVYEPGCGFPHDDADERPCNSCGGAGGWVADAESK